MCERLGLNNPSTRSKTKLKTCCYVRLGLNNPSNRTKTKTTFQNKQISRNEMDLKLEVGDVGSSSKSSKLIKLGPYRKFHPSFFDMANGPVKLAPVFF